MEEFIRELLTKYNNKLYDTNFIESFLKVAINYYELNDWVQNINIKFLNNPGEKYIAVYDYLEKSITVYKSQLKEFIEEKGDSILYKNLYLIQILLHELEHASQNKLIYTSDTIEAQILKYSMTRDERDFLNKRDSKSRIITYLNYLNLMYLINLRRVILKNKNYYIRDTYIAAPEERLAQYKSYGRLLKALNNSGIPYDVFRKIELNNLHSNFNAYLSIDSEYASPTVKYLTALKYDRQLSQFDWYDKDKEVCYEKSRELYSFEDRLALGLPISKEEINKNYYRKLS